MTRNVGTVDRVFRGLFAAILLACLAVAPLSLGVRLAAFALPGVYMLFTSLAGTCFGYRLMGRSTCAR